MAISDQEVAAAFNHKQLLHAVNRRFHSPAPFPSPVQISWALGWRRASLFMIQAVCALHRASDFELDGLANGERLDKEPVSPVAYALRRSCSL